MAVSCEEEGWLAQVPAWAGSLEPGGGYQRCRVRLSTSARAPTGKLAALLKSAPW